MSLIIFDLDGTLVDSRLDLANSTNELLESYGASPLPVDRVAGMVGEGAKMLVARALIAAGARPDVNEALDRFRQIYDRRLVENTRPYDGIAEVLRRAASRTPLAVLTNKPLAPTRRLLDAFGLSDVFRDVLGGDSPFPRKPKPDSTRHLMQTAGATPGTTLFVGDSMIDVETARNADVPICVARYGFGWLRGELNLRGDEIVAMSPHDVGAAIDDWLARLKNPA
jgi:phosphoglycolate phosphatase